MYGKKKIQVINNWGKIIHHVLTYFLSLFSNSVQPFKFITEIQYSFLPK